MYPYVHAKPIRYLYDEFDGTKPWRGYWGLRDAEAAYPATPDSTVNSYHVYPARDNFTCAGGKLVAPMHTWATIPAHPRSALLAIKVKSLPPPFTFQIAWKFSDHASNPFDSGTPTHWPFTLSTHFVGSLTMTTTNSGTYNFSLNAGSPSNGGSQLFGAAEFTPNEALYYKFKIEADLMAEYDLARAGVTIPYHTSASYWHPNTPRQFNASYATLISGSYPVYFPIRLGAFYGWKLDYLEVKIHDHTV